MCDVFSCNFLCVEMFRDNAEFEAIKFVSISKNKVLTNKNGFTVICLVIWSLSDYTTILVHFGLYQYFGTIIGLYQYFGTISTIHTRMVNKTQGNCLAKCFCYGLRYRYRRKVLKSVNQKTDTYQIS